MTEEEKIRLEFQNKIMEIACEEDDRMWRWIRRMDIIDCIMEILMCIMLFMFVILTGCYIASLFIAE